MSKNKNLTNTLILTSVLSFIFGFGAYLIQTKAISSVSSCSYADPLVIDILALLFAPFLIIEGTIDIFKHKISSPVSQLARILRINVGVSITVIHIIQLMHK